MRRSDKQITDPATLADILNHAPICHIAMVDGVQPYVVAMNFGFDGQHIYLHSAREGRKVAILRQNPRVCITCEQEGVLVPGAQGCQYSYRYRSIIGEGTAEFIEEPAGKAYALNQIMRHYEANWTPSEFTAAPIAEVLIIKITLQQLSGKASKLYQP